ncbi:MAG: hypothetical protein K8T89_13965 [Planctomycetes bacterium]|nr:hypothetical protein [Planctomycetota bacterium]
MISRSILGLVAILLLASASRAETNDELAAQALKILKVQCARCHPGQGGASLDIFKHETMIAERGKKKPFIVPGKPDASYLFERVNKGSMPPEDEEPLPTVADKIILKKWIEAGAPAFKLDLDNRPAVDRKIVMESILKKLNSVERENAKFYRFFSLANLHNNPMVTAAELRMSRAAMSKAINSLSMKRRIVVPEAIDAQQTVFAIDVREIGWDEEDLWREVMKAYPYALSVGDSTNETLRNLEKDISRLLPDVKIPVVRVDWFVSTATRPPLYHTLLGIPKTATELEKTLGVNVQNNYASDSVNRAGFSKSGVSQQNRMVERHESSFGAYWKSFDFRANKPKTVLTQFPLGPVFKNNPHENLAFEHDGGEIVFALPNHLQGYMLINNKEERIDEGPVDIVNDRKKVSGTPVIVNGVSCMACHKDGMITFKDEIRDGNSLAGDALMKVKKIYPEDKVMQKLVKDDQEQFLLALERATGTFLKVGPDKDKAIDKFDEPIGELTQRYRLKPVDLNNAAYELDIAPARSNGMTGNAPAAPA